MNSYRLADAQVLLHSYLLGQPYHSHSKTKQLPQSKPVVSVEMTEQWWVNPTLANPLPGPPKGSVAIISLHSDAGLSRQTSQVPVHALNSFLDSQVGQMTLLQRGSNPLCSKDGGPPEVAFLSPMRLQGSSSSLKHLSLFFKLEYN